MAYKQFKIQGQTTADAAIATVSVDYDADGFITFADSESNKHRIPVTGPFAELVKLIFTGTGGIDAGSSGVQGHRVFGVPKLKQ